MVFVIHRFRSHCRKIELHKDSQLSWGFDFCNFLYYKSFYKGTGSSYGKMTDSDPYKKLDNNGIVVSQGLWRFDVVFSKDGNWDGVSHSTDEITATSGEIFINLNTTSIPITINQDLRGKVVLEGYSLVNFPSSNSYSISVDLYQYSSSDFKKVYTLAINPNGNTFSSNGVGLPAGLYSAVVNVIETVSSTSKTIFTDCVGFVIRNGLTTYLAGSYTYNTTSTGGVVIVKPESSDSSAGSTDIKEFINEQFDDDTTYIIDESNGTTYYLFPKNETFVKTLQDNTDITIDTNGVNIINTNSKSNKEKDARTYFVLNASTSLTLINSKEGTKTVYGCSDSKIKSQYQTNFRLNGGKLTIGTTKAQGQINLKGCPAAANIQNGQVRHPAVEFAPNGGIVELKGINTTSDEQKKVQIEETVIGIGTDPTTTSASLDEQMIITIDMDNSYINAQGENSLNAYGIYINGYGRKGSIVINVNNKSVISSSKTATDGCGIYIENFKGSIAINIDNSDITSSGNYGIHINECEEASISISKKGDYCSISGKTAAVYINGSVKTFSTKGKIEISSSNTTTTN